MSLTRPPPLLGVTCVVPEELLREFDALVAAVAPELALVCVELEPPDDTVSEQGIGRLAQQPLTRLEAETGAQLLQRVGRGVRLTPAGRLLADRASEILGRVDAAAAELSAHVGLSTGRVRLAGFTSVLSTLVPAAAELLRREHPGLELTLTDTHPPEALHLLRAGHVDLALIFRYDESPPEDEDLRLVHLLDDPTYLLTTGPTTGVADHHDSTWIAGCERCRAQLVDKCERAGFTPRIAYTTDDMVLMQALVTAGLGVTMIPGLALRSHKAPGITATEIPTSTRRVYAATYGAPPDPPPTAALIAALQQASAPGNGSGAMDGMS